MEKDYYVWEEIALEDGIIYGMEEKTALKQLKKAVFEGNVKKVKQIVTENSDSYLNLDKRLSDAFLYYEIDKKNYLEIIKFLIEKGADLNWKDKDGDTFLHQKDLLVGHPELIQLLLTYLAVNPTIRNNKGKIPIDIKWSKESIVWRGDPRESIRLIRNHILTKRMEHLKAKSELLHAVEKNDVTRAAYLMNKYPYFTKHYRDAEGVSLLRKAIESAGDSSDLVKHTIAVAPELLLIQDNDGRAPYHNPAIGQLMLLVIDDPTR